MVIYKLGDQPHTEDLHVAGRSKHTISSLKEGEGVFLRRRPPSPPPAWGGPIYESESTCDWNYAVVAKIVRCSPAPAYMVFQTSIDGSTKTVNEHLWGELVRPLNRRSSSRYRKGTLAAPYHPVSVQDDSDQMEEETFINAITALPVYELRSFEELRLEDYTANNKGKLPPIPPASRTAEEQQATKPSAQQKEDDSRKGPAKRKGRPPMVVSEWDEFSWMPSDPKWITYSVGDTKSPDRVQFCIRSRRNRIQSKRHVLKIISKTRKGSRERGAIIKFLVAEGYVPVKANCLYNLIRDTEEKGLPVGNDNWSCVGRPSRSAKKEKNPDRSGHRDKTTYDKESAKKNEAKKVSALIQDDGQAKPSLCGKMGWLGSLVFPPESLAAVHLGDDLADVKMWLLEYARNFEIPDLCNFIGGYQNDLTRTDPRLLKKLPACRLKGMIHRIYFTGFKTPRNLGEAGSCITFDNLRSFIQKHARASGSPVVCNGGGPDKKRFTCIHNSETQNQPESVRCPFGFTVKWDEIGYYVHLSKGETEKLNPNGCQWHLCPAK